MPSLTVVSFKVGESFSNIHTFNWSSDTSKYFLIASAPDSHLGVIEPLTRKPDWVSFWKVPSNAPVWGLKPIDLGNYVPKQDYPNEFTY